MSRRQTKSSLRPDQLAIVWQSASLLLNYPDDDLVARLDLIRAGSHELPTTIGDSLRSFVAHLEATPLQEMQAEYV